MKKTVPLNKNYEFIRVYKRGKFFVGKYIVLYVLPNKYKENRLGIAISKKYGKSVKRNRLRRIIKENYRMYEDYLKDGYDIVITARNFTSAPEFSIIKKEMKFLMKKLKVFDQEKWNCLKSY